MTQPSATAMRAARELAESAVALDLLCAVTSRQNLMGLSTYPEDELRALESVASLIDREIRPLVDACRSALAVESQIGEHDTTRGPHHALIEQLRSALRHAEEQTP